MISKVGKCKNFDTDLAVSSSLSLKGTSQHNMLLKVIKVDYYIFRQKMWKSELLNLTNSGLFLFFKEPLPTLTSTFNKCQTITPTY